jgi:GntR family transcriptional regulator, transcriptional repressor for pyruvate dehydrogenase complex
MPMPSVKRKDGTKLQKRHLVQEAAAKLRDLILTREPGTQIGSLNEVAQLLGVGIVTVQQAARVLEHEGLLSVRRGPGGGYYGTRPDEAALERSLAAYLRVHGFGYREALDMSSLLDCEIIPAATHCRDEKLREALRALVQRIDGCDSGADRVAFEEEFRELLFKMVVRPLIEFLLRVTLRQYMENPSLIIFAGDEAVAIWKAGRRRVLEAVLQQDEALARFEAERFRQQVLAMLRKNDPAAIHQ